MRKLILIFALLPFAFNYPQHLGQVEVDTARVKFLPNEWGVNLMFGDGGFGLGSYLRKRLTNNIKGFVDISISEIKDDREIQYVDIFGRTFTVGKKNRVIFIPITAGVQYRLFSETLTEVLRPYLTAGAGPSIIVTTPYYLEFFKSFAKAHANIAASAYVGVGALFGISKSNTVGLNARYYFVHLFNKGVESLYNRFQKNIGAFYISLDIGLYY